MASGLKFKGFCIDWPDLLLVSSDLCMCVFIHSGAVGFGIRTASARRAIFPEHARQAAGE